MLNRWVVLIMTLLAGLMMTFGGKQTALSCDLELQRLERPQYDVVYLTVPVDSKFTVIPAVSPKLDVLETLVKQSKEPVYAAINAGFFDPTNKLTTSYVLEGGQITTDPTQNRHFMDNPDLAPYLPAMLNRSEFRVLNCQGKRRYDIAKHQAPLPSSCVLNHSLQAGPNLLIPGSATEEAFIAEKNGVRTRDPLGVDRLNARSAIGIDAEGNALLVMVSMKPLGQGNPSGISLWGMKDLMQELGATQALSLDGGSSSTFWYDGMSIYGKLDASQKTVKRPVKSALFVIKEDSSRTPQ